MAGLNLSAFDVIGPAMVGPSSSHTAGAVRLGLIGRQLLGGTPRRADIGLHGSFAATGRGHGTDRALVAGLLGFFPDHEAIPQSFEHARQAGLEFVFSAIDLGDSAHPNSVHLSLGSAEGEIDLTGASLGGGIIQVLEIDGHATALGAARHTLVCWHADQAGFLSRLTSVFAANEVNIATLATTRRSRGGRALTVVETDHPIAASTFDLITEITGLCRVRAFPPLP